MHISPFFAWAEELASEAHISEFEDFWQTLPDSTAVTVEVVAETRVVSDSVGKYRLQIDTSGMPDSRIQNSRRREG
ncbi:MAG: hypothetical protein GYA39_01980 [Methanothrix sp.]|nr:hypothetical protein [Methanothrix sp.]